MHALATTVAGVIQRAVLIYSSDDDDRPQAAAKNDRPW